MQSPAPMEAMLHRPAVRRLFGALNRYMMVPYLRLGLGPLIGNPFTGYIMVLKTRGRKTGRVRYAPVNYAILDGNVYCLSGWGGASHWLRNLAADPQVELLMPGGAVRGTAEVVTDPDEALRAGRAVLIAGGFAGFAFGFNPRTVPDDLLRAGAKDTPVVRITPTGLAAGASDPGGWLWMLAFAVMAWLVLGRRRSR
ncbi:MAG: nitroreductase family deazaflavin-dependent oxidoreductase [Chloroflexi bacterium]|nr:nitroreductase family deazaflavin-dependent oxidoreductase [Chloroflexota bacterium]